MAEKKKYFFPPESPDDNLVFTKFDPSLAFLAGTYHNVFVDIFKPLAAPESKETFRLFPAIRLYQHATELLLKAILQDVCGKIPPNNTHHLMDLFGLICESQCVCDALGADFKFVKVALGELHDADTTATGFRYGIDKKGNPCFPNMPETVDAKKLFEVCEKLWNALWRVHGPV